MYTEVEGWRGGLRALSALAGGCGSVPSACIAIYNQAWDILIHTQQSTENDLGCRCIPCRLRVHWE